MLKALERRYKPILRKEIVRASRAMIDQAALGALPSLPLDHETRLAEIVRRMAVTAITAFAGRVEQQAKAKGKDLELKDFGDFVNKWATAFIELEFVRARITNLARTSREQIIRVITNAQKEGQSIPEAAKGVEKALTTTWHARAEMIARTELHGAANYGAQQSVKDLGFDLQKEWVVVEDHRTRPEHFEADGQVVPQDDPFIVGGEQLMHPGDPAGSGWNVINCRCAVSWVLGD